MAGSEAPKKSYFFTPGELFAGGANREGDSAGTAIGSSPFSSRFQQIYNPSVFGSLPSGGLWIDELGFRVDGPLGTVFETRAVRGIEISLSTTQIGAESLSPIFERNVGSNPETVLSPDQAVLIGSVWGGPDRPGGIGPGFVFHDKPFYYDPAKGSLLLDIKVVGGIDTFALDAQHSSDRSISSVFGGQVGDELPSLGSVSSLALVTQFRFFPAIPEPPAGALFGLGLGAAALALGRHKTTKGRDSVTS